MSIYVHMSCCRWWVSENRSAWLNSSKFKAHLWSQLKAFLKLKVYYWPDATYLRYLECLLCCNCHASTTPAYSEPPYHCDISEMVFSSVPPDKPPHICSLSWLVICFQGNCLQGLCFFFIVLYFFPLVPANGLCNTKIIWNIVCMKNAIPRNYDFKVNCISNTLIPGNELKIQLANSSDKQYVNTVKGTYWGPCYLVIPLAM